MSEKLLITIKSPLQTVDVELPGDACIGGLIPLLAAVCSFSGQFHHVAAAETLTWSLSASCATMPFAVTRTLSDYGVVDGDILHLQESGLQPVLTSTDEASTPAFEDITPGEQTG